MTTPQTELEKTQLEIARLQLEQERHKLAQMQKRQKVVSELGQGAVTVGGAAAKGSKAVLQYIGRWLLWAAFLEGTVLVVFGLVAAFTSVDNGNGFLWNLGLRLGANHTPNLVTAVVLSAVMAAICVPTRIGEKQNIGGLVGLLLAATAIWKYL